MTPDEIDGTAEEIGVALEVAPHPAPRSTLFGTDNPAEVIVRASAVAEALKAVLTSQNMIQDIRGKGHVRVEGWQTLGSMLGVVPVVVWTRPVDGGWEARVEARTVDGRIVGAAESMCTESEGGNWGSRATSNARRSMAQTRAVSKALRGPLGFVVTLAGYSATPAEEMPEGPPQQPVVAQEVPQRQRPSLLEFARAAIRAKDSKRYVDDEAWALLVADAPSAKGLWDLLKEELVELGADPKAVHTAWKATQ